MKKRSDMKISRLSGVVCAVLTGAVTILLLFALILTGISPDTYDINVGQPASKTIYATKDVEDTVTTAQLRQAAANQSGDQLRPTKGGRQCLQHRSL